MFGRDNLLQHYCTWSDPGGKSTCSNNRLLHNVQEHTQALNRLVVINMRGNKTFHKMVVVRWPRRSGGGCLIYVNFSAGKLHWDSVVLSGKVKFGHILPTYFLLFVVSFCVADISTCDAFKMDPNVLRSTASYANALAARHRHVTQRRVARKKWCHPWTDGWNAAKTECVPVILYYFGLPSISWHQAGILSMQEYLLERGQRWLCLFCSMPDFFMH